ncbi:hypothetical protein O4H49_02265 [Kiloniella laminariae]|uniref:Uncharacterized protein n=1 Tax=Kiloniella laminariae TaxID=454162 RepID=A0ABT4LER6_9PROT|nr:hypothetical protein [Kiloniella laminariae]MCZ4279584.1 hypothetical protein [Kiloniella laminariae]
MRHLNYKNILVILLLLIVPGHAYANAGIPMLILAIPAFAISLLPIILIEALYLSKSMALPIFRSAKTVSISNLISTIVGIPLTWFVLVLLQLLTGGSSAYRIDTTLGKILSVTWQAPWLIPHGKDLDWMIPAAGMVLMVPFFFVSWWSEYFVSKKLLPERSSNELKVKVRNANLITYSLLVLWPLTMFLLNYTSSQ